jgi:hypothetical protein
MYHMYLLSYNNDTNIRTEAKKNEMYEQKHFSDGNHNNFWDKKLTLTRYSVNHDFQSLPNIFYVSI